ncbi:MAG TPA: glycosyltransferase [Candidatus Binataceae bacterium]|nr:glycosyltransferase [Candidatus Binataceae bacterium]
MIFVVLGTWEMPFRRPLVEIDAAVQSGLITEAIVVQCGNTEYSSPYMQLVPFYGKEEMERLYENARLIICQAGVGSIMLGLRKRKTVIAIARLSKFDEHIDDHQLEILNVFSRTGAILPWMGADDLAPVLKRSESFVSAGYPFAAEKISQRILSYLDARIRSTD